MGSAIPAWGLFRVLKALESRALTGMLEVTIPGGTVAFLLDGGRLVASPTKLQALSFSRFLERTRGGVGSHAHSPVELAASGVSNEDAYRMQLAHLRGVLGVALPAPASGWTMGPVPEGGFAVPGAPVDLTMELMRVVARFPDAASMRAMLARYRTGGWITLREGAEPVLSAAKTIGDAKVLYLLRQGRSREVGDGVLSDDLNVRVLFALMVCGVLARDPAGSPSTARPSPGAQASGAPGDGPGLKELRAAAAEVARMNLYEVLGVTVDARVSQVEVAARRALRRFAAARFEGTGAEGQALLEQVRARIQEARMTLTDRNLRMSYNRAVGVTTAALDARTADMFEARALFQAGLDLIAARRLDEALPQVEAAAMRDPEEVEYTAAIARILMSRRPAPEALERARALAEHAVEVEPELVEGLLALAAVRRVEGRAAEALELVRRALRLEPDNRDAMAARDLLQPVAKGNKMSFLKKRDTVLDRLRDSVVEGLKRIRKGGKGGSGAP